MSQSTQTDSAVSPVVGVILMVAVTVILSAVIGAFVLDLGGQTKSNPQAGVSFSENPDTGEITVQAISMDNADELKILVDGEYETSITSVGGSQTVSAGDVTVVGVLDGKEATIQSYDGETVASDSGGESNSVPDDAIIIAKDGSGDYETVKAAVDSANDGDYFLVKEGNYNSYSTITADDVTIAGEEGAVLTSGDSGGAHSITVEGDNVTVKNLEFTGTMAPILVGNMSTGDRTVGTNFTSDGNYIHDVSGDGAFLIIGNDATVKNTVVENTNWGSIVDSKNAVVRNSEFTQANLSAYQPTTLRHNTLHYVDAGATVDARENYWGGDHPMEKISGSGDIEYLKYCADVECDTLKPEGDAALVGDEGYVTIQEAVNAASEGETVTVLGGTHYEKGIVLDKNITVTAKSGETVVMEGSGEMTPCEEGYSSYNCAFQITGDAQPIVDGITINNYQQGILAQNSAGDWTLSNMRFEGNEQGVMAGASTGNWNIESTTLYNNVNGVQAWSSTGDWTISDSTIDYSDSRGVNAENSEGAWVIQNSAITNTGVDSNYGSTTGVDADGAVIEGDASTSSFSGNAHNDCTGNVSC